MAQQARDKPNPGAEDQQPVSLVIPCAAEYVGLCRVLAGVVGARGSMNAEDIADLKLAVTEACTCFLPGSDEECASDFPRSAEDVPESLRVDLRIAPGSWEVAVSDAEQQYALAVDSSCVSLDSASLGLTIMRALADRVEHTYAESGGSIVRLFKQIETEAGFLS